LGTSPSGATGNPCCSRHGRFEEAQGQFAPNPEGPAAAPRLIAYTSNESGGL
jgi:hypothetical protein